MFQQPTARSGAGETPSVVRHEKSPKLPEDPGVVGRISPLLPSGGILPPSSSSSSCETCQTTSHYCQICQKNVCNLPTCSVEYLGDEEKRVHKDCVQSPKSGEAGDQENNFECDNFLQPQAADDIEIKTELVSPLLSEQESDHSSPTNPNQRMKKWRLSHYSLQVQQVRKLGKRKDYPSHDPDRGCCQVGELPQWFRFSGCSRGGGLFMLDRKGTKKGLTRLAAGGDRYES